MAAIMLALAGVAAPGADLAATNAGPDTALARLARMSPEELMNIRVTILGPSETVSRTPAAVSVVTADDLQRSGARNIPEALRLVPGLDVAQIDASQWAVSVRGFNDQFANKLLVLQDGRSIYTPLFGGVFWDVQNPMMEDIDHIEVVRGPGATLWGANAVNGVINIITKDAADTQGWLVTGGGGSLERGFADARYGGKINDNAFYRIYGTYADHASTVLTGGADATNSWQMARGGFRLDWDAAQQNQFTFEGDGYAGWERQVFTGIYTPVPPSYSTIAPQDSLLHGADVLGRWTHTFSGTANLQLQSYYDYTGRKATIFDEERHLFDLSLQQQLALGERNQVTAGLGYRVTADTERNNAVVAFNPDRQTVNLYSAFAQDEIALVPDRLSLTLGSKIEHNDYTGVEVEPGGRLLWTPTEKQTVWASVSRAVRTPTRVDETVSSMVAGYPAFPMFPVMANGTNKIESEKLIAYEVGYRVRPLRRLSFDFAAFYNEYNDLRSAQVVSAPAPATVIYFGNNLHGHAYGFEATATWQVTDWWRLQPGYTFLKMKLFASPAPSSFLGFPTTYADNATVDQLEGTSPQNQVSLRSSMDWPHGVTFDAALRYVDALRWNNPPTSFPVESYFELDARVGWRISRHWTAAIVGQNLLHPQHQEFGPTEVNLQATQIPRSVYGEITLEF